MIVRSFLQWFENAPVNERVEATQEMVRAYLSETLGSDSRHDAEAALTVILDDPVVAVRRALAFELAGEALAPRHIIIALAHDISEVSALVLARSHLLRDADLVDCAAVGDVLAQSAIAMRPDLPVTISAALAEVAAAEALVVLVRNPTASISAVSFARMLDRCKDHAPLRQALHEREDLPLAVRQALVASVSQELHKFVGVTGWMAPQRAQRMIGETRDAATISLAVRAEDIVSFVEFLRDTAQLTPGLLLRSLLCGETTLFGAALVSLTGIDPRRVAGMMKSRNDTALFALYRKAGLAKAHFPAFSAAIAAIRDSGQLLLEGEEPRLHRFIIQRALGACLEGPEDAMRGLIGVLRRFDAEAARMDARITTDQIMNAEVPVMIEEASEAPLLIDLDMADIALDAERAVPEADDAESAVDIDFAELEAELQAEVAAAAAEVPVAPALVVIEDQAKRLDERFFANWQIRKRAA